MRTPLLFLGGWFGLLAPITGLPLLAKDQAATIPLRFTEDEAARVWLACDPAPGYNFFVRRALVASPLFRSKVRARTSKHLGSGGILSASVAVSRYRTTWLSLRLSLWAEGARWTSVDPVSAVEAEWQEGVEASYNFLNARPAPLLNHILTHVPPP